jgi:GH15 family glucan-1,4-alpha-glucosidase
VAVYQPSALSANDKLLVTFGESGEVMSMMWPRRDGPNQIREGLLGVYGAGKLHWTWDPIWRRRQSYDTRTRVLSTHLDHDRLGVGLHIHDLLPPGIPALVRTIRVETRGATPGMRLCFAAQVQIGGNPTQQGGWLPEPKGPAIVHGRAGAIAVGGTPFDDVQLNRWGGVGEGSKFNMERGQFAGPGLVIGRVDCGPAWRIMPGAATEIRLCLALGSDEKEARRHLRAAATYRLPKLDDPLGDDEAEPSRRAQIAARARVLLEELREPTTGCWIAAAEFDPEYLESGGYSYCWPRDGADMLRAAAAEGRHDWVRDCLAWLRRTQEPEGFWHQRYWTDGKLAPSWCLPDSGLQLDEPAAVIGAASGYLLSQDAASRSELLAENAEMIARGARYLLSRIDPRTGLHKNAWGLWETFRGSFTYTNAVLAHALRSASTALPDINPDLADRCRAAAAALKTNTIGHLWRGDRFARVLRLDGSVDDAPDSSVFGALASFGLLDPDDADELDMALRCVDVMERCLAMDTPWGPGVARYPDDHYARGAASTVGTLWLAELLLRFALCTGEPELVHRAEGYLAVVEGSATSTGLLSEFFGGERGRWVPGHGWSSAIYLRDLRLLDAARRLTDEASETGEDSERRSAVG